ncbi:conserved hypothetical protein (plasmid) [Borreliella burgdorferi 29805]|uniref:DUF685 domain-containing protein n=4 Tax=Borreliella burgdorferi TaxID=139 RepID=UPI00017F42A8|nr:DUF685 domain-containing protein [Borreliella burgdorferi]ACO38503.1 conserved hypothetical protein [Borreliella burgdorferi 29805]ATH10567.1 DUF685 domain-containing protein [Borreliella burgdorferi]MCD2309509.1 DUF685 domain-containing protein [Borreliella burgdorferi]MCD2318765.1 DUF685 domain-containing protein [Borreliella burgdorferi]MCD2319844.1 DUF685 domain-containing protein [Borreliella burgdorferi]
MADYQEKLLIDEEEIVQIKDLNKVTTVNNTDLLLLDDGAASSNAITFKNFLKTVNHQTFKGEELGYFKEIIKSTIATELAADNDFIKSIYDLIVDKLIENESSKLSSLYRKIRSSLESDISSTTLSKDDYLLTLRLFGTIEKTPVPKQLLGLPSSFTYPDYLYNTSGTTLYPRDYGGNSIAINMKRYNDVTLVCNKNLDDVPSYFDIDIDIEHSKNGSKSLYLRYSDESQKKLVYKHEGASSISIRVPMYKGWYIQKRAYISGNPVPALFKL